MILRSGIYSSNGSLRTDNGLGANAGLVNNRDTAVWSRKWQKTPKLGGAIGARSQRSDAFRSSADRERSLRSEWRPLRWCTTFVLVDGVASR